MRVGRYLRFVAVLACAGVLLGASSPESDREVDLELVLAVDVSMSMNAEEISIQRRGYLDAFAKDSLIEAILNNGSGRVAVTYMEWAGKEHVRFVVPWMLIDSRAAARRFVEALAGDTPSRVDRTSISNALAHAGEAFEQNRWDGLRRIIDVSGDGPNNEGDRLPAIRDSLVEDGIVINGLAVMIDGAPLGMGIDNLDEYYRACVTGGPGSFVMTVSDWSQFATALELKLLQEITGMPLPPDLAQARPEFMPAQYFPPSKYGYAKDRPVDCHIGEKIWQRFMETFGMQ